MSLEKIKTTENSNNADNFRLWADKINDSIDRLNQLEAGLNSNFRFYGGTTLQMYNTTSGKWHTIWIENIGGVNVIKLADIGDN